MTRMLLSRDDVIVGVDTHKNEHAAVLLDGLGGQLTELVVPATTGGYARLLAVALEHVRPDGRLLAFGVEGTGSYGIGLARYLRRHGHKVIEVNRPPRKGERRLSGKSDMIDAEHAARQTLAGGKQLATPKTADGSVESLRLLKIARDTAVKARTAAMIALKATLVTASDELRTELEPLTDHKLIRASAALDSAASVAAPDAAMRHVLGSLARRWLQLHEEIKVHSRHLKKQTKALAPQLVQAVGVGLDIAAEMLVTAGDNSDRVRSEAAFAKMCGACPMSAGSGRTNGRHRLYRGGNRQANAALYRAVIVRMRWHQPTMDYVTRRTAEGLSKREIMCCLKRYLAREIYHCCRHRLPSPAGCAPLDSYRSFNAAAESLIGLSKPSSSAAAARGRAWTTSSSATLEYVDWFNHRRLHSAYGDLPRVDSSSSTTVRSPPPPPRSRHNQASTEPKADHLGDRSAASPDLLREMVKTFAEALMAAEAETFCNAGYRQRTLERANSRNGYRPRAWDTRAGTIELAVPRCGPARTSKLSRVS